MKWVTQRLSQNTICTLPVKSNNVVHTWALQIEIKQIFISAVPLLIDWCDISAYKSILSFMDGPRTPLEAFFILWQVSLSHATVTSSSSWSAKYCRILENLLFYGRLFWGWGIRGGITLGWCILCSVPQMMLQAVCLLTRPQTSLTPTDMYWHISVYVVVIAIYAGR